MKTSEAINRREFLALSASAAGLALQEQKRPNILLIVADDLAFSDLGCFGGEIETPVLNTLASNGARFAQFYSNARCCPSRASRILYFEHEGHRAVRDDRYKLTALRGESWKLYDMERDRTEMEDLSAKQPKRVDSMSKKWDAWASENQVTPLPANYRVDYFRRR